MTATLINDEDFATELRVFRVGNGSESREDADLIIPGEDLTNRGNTSIGISRRINEAKDSGTMAVKSYPTQTTKGYGTAYGASYGGPDEEPAWWGDGPMYPDEIITAGDRIEFWVSFVETGAPEASGYGEGGYGEGGFGGGPAVHSSRRWTAYAHAPTLTADGPGPVEISFPATDFVFEILSSRIATDAFEDELIAGAEDAIVNSLLEDHAPEIDRSLIEDVDTRTDREFDGRDLKEICSDLAETADALMASEGTALIYRPFDDIPIKHDFGWDDIQGEASSTPDDGELVNDWRIDGGTGTELDEVQETVDSYQTVTEGSPLTFELDPEKNRLDRIDVWTRRTGSQEDLSVRIQAPNSAGDGPRDASDDTKDIVSDRSSWEFLADDGWRDRFRFKHEPLPDKPWLIINSGGDDGQDIGVDENGNPAIRTHYPFPVNVRVDDQDSIEEHRLRQDRMKKTILSSFDAARDVGEAKLRHSAQPDWIISCTARSIRAHLLEPGEVVDVSLEPLGSGPHIVVERSETYDAGTNHLTTELTLQDLETI